MSHRIAVIGCGFGDEGKGLTVDWLSSKYPALPVIRYSGGTQCGHTVRHCSTSLPCHAEGSPDGLMHSFRIWGSGSLRGNPTRLASDVVFDPVVLWQEYLALSAKTTHSPTMTIDPRCPVITPYDLYANQTDDNILAHGTCGAGIFTTKQRERNHYHLHAHDLLFPEVMQLKLNHIRNYYEGLRPDEGLFHEMVYNITHCADIDIVATESVYPNDDAIVGIYESSQGLLLSEDIGFFPHCTPSRVGLPRGFTRNDEVYFVTRAYHTRHGNGTLATERYPVRPNPWETNRDNEYQGRFRSGILDLELLKYAICSDISYHPQNYPERKNLVITNLDVVENDWRLFDGTKVCRLNDERHFVDAILNYISFNFSSVYLNKTPFSGGFYQR